MTSFEHILSFSGETLLAGASSHLLPPTIHPYPVSTVTQDKPGLEPAQKVRERIITSGKPPTSVCNVYQTGLAVNLKK